MPNYSVKMSQGIVNFEMQKRSITLVTGVNSPDDVLQSCSAVIFANPELDRASLYHFPAGDINGDNKSSQDPIYWSSRDVRPTEAYIIYGVYGIGMGVGSSPSDRFNADLRSYVLSVVPNGCRVRQMPAKIGQASVAIEGGKVLARASAPGDCIDCGHFSSGVQDRGTIYWSTDSPKYSGFVSISL